MTFVLPLKLLRHLKHFFESPESSTGSTTALPAFNIKEGYLTHHLTIVVQCSLTLVLTQSVVSIITHFTVFVEIFPFTP